MRIGFEYARFVTNEEQQIEPHLLEPDLHQQDDHGDLEAPVDQEVATATEVCVPLYVYGVVCVCVCCSCCCCCTASFAWHKSSILPSIFFIMFCGYRYWRNSGSMRRTWLAKLTSHSHHQYLLEEMWVAVMDETSD